jgi:hypothetical protein
MGWFDVLKLSVLSVAISVALVLQILAPGQG